VARLSAGLIAAALLSGAPASAQPAPPIAGAVRIATFNTALSREAPGGLVQAFRLGDDPQIAAVVEIIQRVRPDVLLLQEIDHDPEGEALRLLAEALRLGVNGAEPIDYPHRFTAPSNTGEPTGLDLDGDGGTDGPGDAHGWGAFPGQYAMALLSRLPIGRARAFRRLPWAAMPHSRLPRDFYGEAAEALRLSSKSHWDVTVDGWMRLLASHPTPPVFDGPEDRNGRRNADELRFWADYLAGETWIVDDNGAVGGFDGAGWPVLAGDLNADPMDGDGRRAVIAALLDHPMLQDPAPSSVGGAFAATPGHSGDPARDTADWSQPGGPGGLRVDYVLPARALQVAAAGVFWPAPGDPLRRLIGEAGARVSSDHRLVLVDVMRPGVTPPAR
jgi:endonuclease/exonuclease/phosphatase family metal-dependent hydrolase